MLAFALFFCEIWPPLTLTGNLPSNFCCMYKDIFPELFNYFYHFVHVNFTHFKHWTVNHSMVIVSYCFRGIHGSDQNFFHKKCIDSYLMFMIFFFATRNLLQLATKYKFLMFSYKYINIVFNKEEYSKGLSKIYKHKKTIELYSLWSKYVLIQKRTY